MSTNSTLLSLSRGLIAGAIGTAAVTLTQRLEMTLTGRVGSQVPGRVGAHLTPGMRADRASLRAPDGSVPRCAP